RADPATEVHDAVVADDVPVGSERERDAMRGHRDLDEIVILLDQRQPPVSLGQHAGCARRHDEPARARCDRELARWGEHAAVETKAPEFGALLVERPDLVREGRDGHHRALLDAREVPVDAGEGDPLVIRARDQLAISAELKQLRVKQHSEPSYSTSRTNARASFWLGSALT